MIYQMIYIIEIISIVKCIHCVYGERILFNGKFLLVALIFYISMNVANYYPIQIECSFFMYVSLGVYCVYTFKRNFKMHIINYTLFLIILTIVEFLSSMAVNVVIKDNTLLRTACSAFLTMVFCLVFLARLELHKLSVWAIRKNVIFYAAMLYIYIFVGTMIARFKVFGGFYTDAFIMGAPLAIFVLVLSSQGAKYQNYYEQKEEELKLYVTGKERNNELITGIRMRQHEINNHITAILAMHYTQGTYEGLVKAQKEYCEQIKADNKYNSLIPLTNSILAGFLYDKFREFEGRGMTVEYDVAIKNYNAFIPEYYLVEILGILLDNAYEAVVGSDMPHKIQVIIKEDLTGYEYTVRNPYRYVSYDEIESWFQYEKSSKGNGRGLGLYHLKEICREWDSIIRCNNVECDNLNWIEFVIRTGRKD